MKIWEITTAKFKCTREHILGHDWLIIYNHLRLSVWTKLRREFVLGQDTFLSQCLSPPR